ncbi:MAG: DNA polymerase IV [Ignavibacteriaceae bacterium]
MIFHLDLDAFFVSVERILDPSLEGKPVIVGGDPSGRGVVAACSYEARSYGLRSGMPIKTAFRLCPQGIYLHGHGAEYSRYSGLVLNILEQYAPLVEQASIDEFYMDFSGCERIYGSLFLFAQRIQKEVMESLYLPCSIGIGRNKLVAKICSDFNKPMGITYVFPGMEKEFLAPLPVEAIPGVGEVLQRELNSKGIYKTSDLIRLSGDYLFSAFGKYGKDLWEKANGRGSEYLSKGQKQKSISKETTFEKDVLSKVLLEEILYGLTTKVCYTLRKKGFLASTITVKLRYSDFVTYNHSKTIPFTNDEKDVYETAVKLLRDANTRRVGVRLVGVSLSNFTGFCFQEILFRSEMDKRERMLIAVDELRRKYGYSIIHN